MMANDGHIAKDTLFGPERYRARAIDWDQGDRRLHQGAQPLCCNQDAFGAASGPVALAPHYVAATEITPASIEKTFALGEPSIHDTRAGGGWIVTGLVVKDRFRV